MFNGDRKQLDLILKTLEAKVYAIPGITTNANLSVSAMGEVASFYVQGEASAKKGHSLGSKQTEVSAGVKRIDVSLTEGYGIHKVIPNVNFATVTPDVVGDTVIQESLKRANLHNEDFVEHLKTSAVAKTYTQGKTALQSLQEAVGTFKKDNKVNGFRPTGVLATIDFYNDLVNDLKGRNTDRVDNIIFDGSSISVGGIPVIEAVDLEGADFILINAEGVAAPINVQSLVVVDGTPAGYTAGALISGELGAGFKTLKKADQPTLGTNGYHVAKFTEAA